MKTFDIVVAADKRLGIGKNGTLPWKLPGDMAFFKNTTTAVKDPTKRNAVIMGRKTWESIPPKFRPLPKRLNVVLTRSSSLELPPDVLTAQSLDEALDVLGNDSSVETIFLIGGGEVFSEGLRHPACRTLYLTEIDHDFDCDVFLPHHAPLFERVDTASQPTSDNGISYRFSKFIHLALLLFAVLACVSAEAQSQKGDVARGAKVFQTMMCAQCHPGGENFIDPRKPIKGAAFVKKYPTDESIAVRIREGSSNGGMPAFRKDRLSDQQLVDVIAYVRSLTPAASKQAAPAKSTSTTKACPPAQSPPLKRK